MDASHGIIRKLHREHRPTFLTTWQGHATHGKGTLPAEQTETVFPTVERDGRTVSRSHTRSGSQLTKDVCPLGTRRCAVQFLHRHDIRSTFPDHGSHAFHALHTVEPIGVTHVVCHECQSVSIREDTSGCGALCKQAQDSHHTCT